MVFHAYILYNWIIIFSPIWIYNSYFLPGMFWTEWGAGILLPEGKPKNTNYNLSTELSILTTHDSQHILIRI